MQLLKINPFCVSLRPLFLCNKGDFLSVSLSSSPPPHPTHSNFLCPSFPAFPSLPHAPTPPPLSLCVTCLWMFIIIFLFLYNCFIISSGVVVIIAESAYLHLKCLSCTTSWRAPAFILVKLLSIIAESVYLRLKCLSCSPLWRTTALIQVKLLSIIAESAYLRLKCLSCSPLWRTTTFFTSKTVVWFLDSCLVKCKKCSCTWCACVLVGM